MLRVHPAHIQTSLFVRSIVCKNQDVGFLACVVRGGFHLHPVTPLSFKSDDSNFVQNYFGVGSIFWGKKNWDQINNDVTMTSSYFD